LPCGQRRADFSSHSFNNYDIGFLKGQKRESPKEQLRALKESSASNRKLNKLTYFYHGFWLFARSEAILFCFWSRCVATGVTKGSTSAGDAGEDRDTVVRNAGV
jgi:hypothetical protein